MVCPFRLPENDGVVFAGIGFGILVALAGFGNPISSERVSAGCFLGFQTTSKADCTWFQVTCKLCLRLIFARNHLGIFGAKTAEILCLGFGCWGRRGREVFCKGLSLHVLK